MGKYEELIGDNSLWITATPATVLQNLPCYLTEAGHFYAQKGYEVRREEHDSFLCLYTVQGTGVVRYEDRSLRLPSGCAVVVDCHKPHQYGCEGESWEFLWLHMKGNGIPGLYLVLYPEGAGAVQADYETESRLRGLLELAGQAGVRSSMDISLGIHGLFSCLLTQRQAGEDRDRPGGHEGEVQAVIDYIRENYAEQVSLEDMLRGIPVSRYHFVRVFRRITGVTPYSYLINYRIHISKLLLRTTDRSVAEIACSCGFSDASNFINQFKRHTGQRPLQYRRDF